MAVQREIERKYEVPVDFAVPDLAGVNGVATVDDPVEHDLSATYYDTPGLRLAAQRITLRRRTGGHDAGWHLKRLADRGDRTETQLPLGAEADGVPAEVMAAVRVLSRGEPLQPVAHIATRRLERALRDRDGTVLALVADDVVNSEAFGDPAVLQQWRELEVELVEGGRPLLDRVDRVLADAGAQPSGTGSKLARALADRYPSGSPVARVEGTAAGALVDYIRAQRDAIVDTDPGVRAGDPEAVHDMRVATRRLRSTLRTFRPVLNAENTEPLRDELQWLGGLLGAVRDGDVMEQRLFAAIAAEPPELVVGPVAAHIHQRLQARTGQARTLLVEALDGPRYVALLDRLDELVASPPAAPVTRSGLHRLARKAIRRADRRLAEADRAPEPGRAAGVHALRLTLPSGGDRNVKLHEARKAYKRGRYAVELLRPLAGKPAKRLAERLTELQDVLGTHQDATVTGALLRDYGMRAHLDGDNAFTYGLLHARQYHAGEETLRELRRVRRAATRRKVRRWLTG
jgi:CHAD domain-containing protein